MKKVKPKIAKAQYKAVSYSETQVIDTFVTRTGATGTLYANGVYRLDNAPNPEVSLEDPYLYALSTSKILAVERAVTQTVAQTHTKDDVIIYGADRFDLSDSDVTHALTAPNWLGDVDVSLGVISNPYDALAADTHKDTKTSQRKVTTTTPAEMGDETIDYAPVANPSTDELWLEMINDKPIFILSETSDDDSFTTDT